MIRNAFFVACCVLLSGASNAEPPVVVSEETFAHEIVPFLKKHCYECHGPKAQKSERRFDELTFPISNDNMLADFQDALDLLNLGEMPPEDSTQPEAEEKAKVIAWLTDAISLTHETRASTGGETVLRRLNRREYRYTVGDLLHIDIDSFDPTSRFPADQKVHHLDNQGNTLVTSGFLLEQYLRAADVVVRKAIPSLSQPVAKEYNFTGGFQAQPELHSRFTKFLARQASEKHLSAFENTFREVAGKGYAVDLKRIRTRGTSQLDAMLKDAGEVPSSIRLYEHPLSKRHMGSYGYVSQLAGGVPEDGFYQLTLDVEAMYRKPQYKKDYARVRSDEPMVLAIVPGDRRVSALHLSQPIETQLARFDLADKREKLHAKIWLHAGTTPRFIWPNGSAIMRSAHIALGKDLLAEKGIDKPAVEEAFVYGLEHGKLPHIRIHSVNLKGPVYSQWPTRGQSEVLGLQRLPTTKGDSGDKFDPTRNRANVTAFLRRAYRRPVVAEEVEAIMQVIDTRVKQGRPAMDAFRDGLKAALCSPGFLYLDEPADSTGERLGQFAIASRLSYFLWSSMPDERLMSLADQGKLLDPAVLAAQVDRMLGDAKSDRFIEGFLDSWLTLSALGDTPPDQRTFPEYYADNLRDAMLQETRLFARHIIDESLQMDVFLNSDFTFVNASLARLYGLDVKLKGREFQKVSTAGSRRGGLLGHASVLTVTANGVDTSPIVRGVWLLENILGTPPSPPPPDVEPLDPDIRGAKTIRDQMEKHRSNASCAECHRKIDPLGFALENYDAIGRWRNTYKKSGAIDASGVLPDGSRFENISQFKSALTKQRNKFARALAEKLLSYAIGRGIEISDRPEVDAILKDVERQQRSFRSLIHRIVVSDIFLKP